MFLEVSHLNKNREQKYRVYVKHSVKASLNKLLLPKPTNNRTYFILLRQI
jgi:hypothetical protein